MRIFDFLGNKSSTKILTFFLENPTKEVQIKDIVKNTRLSRMSVIKWTKEMAKYEVLSVYSVGRTALYSLNKNNQTVKQIKILYNIDYISEKTQKTGTEAQVFVYGSFARGENNEKSDIDILVIGKNRDVIKKIKSIDSRIKVSFCTPVEWSMTARKDKAFFDSVEKDKIRIR